MRLAIGIGVVVEDFPTTATYVREAEKLGVDAVWSAESWGHDAATPLAFLAAQTSTITLGTGIMQVPARTPAMTATTALTLATMSNDRFVLGLGASGPQVAEGWHGQQFGSTVQRLREYVEIVRLALTGEKLSYEGEIFRLPRPGGEGKAIKLAAPTRAKPIPIYLATLSPKTLELTGEIADGWVGTSFMPEHADVHFGPIKRGLERAGRDISSIDLQAGGTVSIGDDVERMIASRKKGLAFQLGAMGSRKHNFYNQAFRRAGYEDVGEELQRVHLEGRRSEAATLIPDEMITQSNLLGTPAMVKDRIRAYRDCGVTTLRVDPAGGSLQERLDTLGQVVQLVKQVDAE